MAAEGSSWRLRNRPGLPAIAKRHGNGGKIGKSGSGDGLPVCRRKRRGRIVEKKTKSTTATRTDVLEGMSRPGRESTKATGITLALLLMMSVLSCECEQDSQDEAMLEGLRNAIGVIETRQQGHLVAQNENAELHEKHQLKSFALRTKPPTERARENLIRTEKSYAKGWQDDLRERIDSVGREELILAAKELRNLGEKADMGKTFTESDTRRLVQRQAASPQDRLFQRRS